MLECADGSLYTGITKDLDRRVVEHNQSHLGAAYTRMRRPVQLVWSASFASRAEASREEYRIKHLTRVQKVALLHTR